MSVSHILLHVTEMPVFLEVRAVLHVALLSAGMLGGCG